MKNVFLRPAILSLSQQHRQAADGGLPITRFLSKDFIFNSKSRNIQILYFGISTQRKLTPRGKTVAWRRKNTVFEAQSLCVLSTENQAQMLRQTEKVLPVSAFYVLLIKYIRNTNICTQRQRQQQQQRDRDRDRKGEGGESLITIRQSHFLAAETQELEKWIPVLIQRMVLYLSTKFHCFLCLCFNTRSSQAHVYYQIKYKHICISLLE